MIDALENPLQPSISLLKVLITNCSLPSTTRSEVPAGNDDGDSPLSAPVPMREKNGSVSESPEFPTLFNAEEVTGEFNLFLFFHFLFPPPLPLFTNVEPAHQFSFTFEEGVS